MNLNYNHLRYFWTVAREGRLTQAASRLALSQSALSAQIRKLELSLGLPLFERRGRGLALTEAGQIALDYADAIFSAGDEMLARLNRESGAEPALLRIGALSTLSRNFQIRVLRPLLADNVRIFLRSGTIGELIPALEAHRLDVVLVNQAPLRDPSSHWTAHLLDEQAVSLVGAPARVRGRADYQNLLASEPLILPTADSGFRNSFDVLAARMGLKPRIAAEVDDMAMLRLLAREDAGLAALPPIVVADELASGRLTEACRLPGVAESFFAIVLSTRFAHPMIDRLLAACKPDLP